MSTRAFRFTSERGCAIAELRKLRDVGGWPTTCFSASPVRAAILAYVVLAWCGVSATHAESKPFRHSISVDFGINHPRLPATQDKLLRRLAELKRAGLRQVRLELSMRDTEQIDRDLRHPAVELVKRIRALDLDVIAVVGVGGRRALRPGLHVDDPSYVDEMARNVSAIAGRFAREGLRVDYQVENELNVAGLSTLSVMRWRTGRRWWSGPFKRELLERLAQAVREADPRARVHTNFFDGLSDPAVEPAAHAGIAFELRAIVGAALSSEPNLRRSVRQLSRAVDEVGLDVYTNYVLPLAVTRRVGWVFDRIPALRALGTGDPGAFIARRVSLFRRLTGKPVHVAELGYPTRSLLGHTPAGQAQYLGEVLPAVRRSGAVGVNVFRLFDYPPHEDGPRRWLDPNRQVEPYFGLYDADLEPKHGATLGWGRRMILRLGLPWPERRPISAADVYRRELAATD